MQNGSLQKDIFRGPLVSSQATATLAMLRLGSKFKSKRAKFWFGKTKVCLSTCVASCPLSNCSRMSTTWSIGSITAPAPVTRFSEAQMCFCFLFFSLRFLSHNSVAVRQPPVFWVTICCAVFQNILQEIVYWAFTIPKGHHEVGGDVHPNLWAENGKLMFIMSDECLVLISLQTYNWKSRVAILDVDFLQAVHLYDFSPVCFFQYGFSPVWRIYECSASGS